jgi:hypothetical protein
MTIAGKRGVGCNGVGITTNQALEKWNIIFFGDPKLKLYFRYITIE